MNTFIHASQQLFTNGRQFIVFAALMTALAVVGAPLSLLGAEPMWATTVPAGLAWALFCLGKRGHTQETQKQQHWARLSYLAIIIFALGFWH